MKKTILAASLLLLTSLAIAENNNGNNTSQTQTTEVSQNENVKKLYVDKKDSDIVINIDNEKKGISKYLLEINKEYENLLNNKDIKDFKEFKNKLEELVYVERISVKRINYLEIKLIK